jgi:hypothetical protein
MGVFDSAPGYFEIVGMEIILCKCDVFFCRYARIKMRLKSGS